MLAVDQVEEGDGLWTSEDLNIASARDRMSSGDAPERDTEWGGSEGR